MRKKRPSVATLDEVLISRDGDDAIIEFTDSSISTTHLKLGPEVQELSIEQFGRLLTTYSGWGMRIVFVPDDEIEQTPRVEVREPDRDER